MSVQQKRSTERQPRRWLRAATRSGLFWRVVPLVLLILFLALIVLFGLSSLGTNRIKELAVEESHDALADKALADLELRARDLGRRVAAFLREREQDARALAQLEPSAQTYLDFSRTKLGQIWNSQGTSELPLYKEIAFVDTAGQEIIRVEKGQIVPQADLRDVSQPENTEYLRETYFQEGMALDQGQVYVQRLMGWYLPVSEAYANAENPDGRRYQGVVRFVTPVYQAGQRAGLLVLSLDWTHGMELIAHVVGTEEGYLPDIPADPGSPPGEPKLADIHSYLVGDDGWALYHAKHHAIVGLDENGEYVTPLNQDDFDAQRESGYMPVNANYMEFLGTEEVPYPWPIIAEANRQGVESGNFPNYSSASDVVKAMAWASVPYYTPPHNTPAGFGWVGISVDANKFNERPNALGQEISHQVRGMSNLSYGLLAVVSLLAVGFIGFVVYQTVSRPVGRMVAAAQRVAGGDLAPIPLDGARQDSNDELVQLQVALAQMVEQLRAIITRIRGAALHISSAAEEVKATLHEQAGAATQSASAVTETTAAMEELAIIAAQIAQRSGSVVGEASETQEDAQSGARAVSETVTKLDEIRLANESNVSEIMALGRKSRRIGEVMELIDNIASRTKLIAFNAALEAAAAGESGQRFSVVAMEVRRLADNVVESTDEIRERIAEIQAATNALIVASEQEAKRIAEGVARGKEASQTLNEILVSAQSTTSSAEQISLSTQQQRTAAEQVVDAVRGIERDSRAVAHGSEEATHVISDLVQLAEELQRAVEQFDVGEEA
ncbi:MAG: methyl-accepting chemotaxis protein [Anaerolineae bacterium]